MTEAPLNFASEARSLEATCPTKTGSNVAPNAVALCYTQKVRRQERYFESQIGLTGIVLAGVERKKWFPLIPFGPSDTYMRIPR
jgi:hypothetical protein